MIDSGLSALFFGIEALIYGRPITRSPGLINKSTGGWGTGGHQQKSCNQQNAHDKSNPPNLQIEINIDPTLIR